MSTVNNDRNVLDPTAGAMAGVDARNKSAMAETEDRFLTMLITQLRNQDPLNPMDNAQVTTQMAQMSTVAGIQQLNTTLLAVAVARASAASAVTWSGNVTASRSIGS